MTTRDNISAIITAEDNFTDALLVEARDLVSLTAVRTAFTGTYTLQRKLDLDTWRDVTDGAGNVQSWTGKDLNTTYTADEGGELRMGVKLTEFAGTSLYLRLGKG